MIDRSIKHGIVAGGLVILLGGPLFFLNNGTSPEPAVQVVNVQHTIDPYRGNPNAGVIKAPRFKDLTCADVFGDLPQMYPKRGYGSYFLKQDRTKIVGEDPNIGVKYHIYAAVPGTVKHCSMARDKTDCKCDLLTNMCSREAYWWGGTTINRGLQDPRIAGQHLRRVDMDAVYATFESLCRGG